MGIISILTLQVTFLGFTKECGGLDSLNPVGSEVCVLSHQDACDNWCWVTSATVLDWGLNVCLYLHIGLLVCFSHSFVSNSLWPHRAPLSVGFSRQDDRSGSPFPSPGDLPDPGIEPVTPALQADSLSQSRLGSSGKGTFISLLCLSIYPEESNSQQSSHHYCPFFRQGNWSSGR